MLRREKYEDLAAGYGWDVRHGEARFVEGPALVIDGERVEAAHYLIASGAAPWVPAVPGLDETGYLTSTTALELDELPGSLIVVGGNYVGLEMGQIFARLGSSVTLIEALDRLAPGEEPELSEVITGVLKDEGVEVWTSAALVGVSRQDGQVVARVADGREVRADAILMATGRRPVTAGLGLNKVGVETGRVGEVVVDDGLGGPLTRGFGRPGTSPVRRSSSTWPARTGPWWSTTLSTASDGPSTTRICPGSPSPAPTWPRSA